jgi:hypothetical protein
MLTTDAYGNPYQMLDFTDVDCRVLQDAVAARTRNLRLASIRLATGQLAITVMARISARSLVDFEPPIIPQWSDAWNQWMLANGERFVSE